MVRLSGHLVADRLNFGFYDAGNEDRRGARPKVATHLDRLDERRVILVHGRSVDAEHCGRFLLLAGHDLVKRRTLALIGALSFVASDLLLSINTFLTPIDSLASVIWPTYVLAQILIPIELVRTSTAMSTDSN